MKNKFSRDQPSKIQNVKVQMTNEYQMQNLKKLLESHLKTPSCGRG